MPSVHWKTVVTTALCVAVGSQVCRPAFGQAPAPATILTIDLENIVVYNDDTADPSKFATDPGITTGNLPKNLYQHLLIADIVAVNGQPAKGVQILRAQLLNLRRNPSPGDAIADIGGGESTLLTWAVLKPDGTQVGTLVGVGLTGPNASPAPGAALAATSGNVAILGGTGAFLGARGVSGQGVISAPNRQASIAEDPSNRRRTPGGKAQSVIYLIPMERPEIVTTSSGPAVFHADFSPITAVKPAKAGEVLIVKATGLGPTVPGVNPGQPFPTDAILQVNSPVAVTVNGQAAEVVDSIGWPGLVDTYRVDLRVPDGATGGTAAIQLTAAWIAGASVSIPTQ